MAPLEPKAITVISLGILFFVFVIAYYFVKFKNRHQPTVEAPQIATHIVKILIIILLGIIIFATFITGVYGAMGGRFDGIWWTLFFLLLSLWVFIRWVLKKTQGRNKS